jgi:hypothetical protein
VVRAVVNCLPDAGKKANAPTAGHVTIQLRSS